MLGDKNGDEFENTSYEEPLTGGGDEEGFEGEEPEEGDDDPEGFTID